MFKGVAEELDSCQVTLTAKVRARLSERQNSSLHNTRSVRLDLIMEPAKRVKTAEAPRDEDRLKKLLAYIGDFGLESLGPHTTKLVATVSSLYEQHQNFILHIFSECVCCLPHKAQIYAQVHSSLCAQIADFHTSACAAVGRKLLEAAQSSDVVRGKGAVRFIAYLARLKLAEVAGFQRLLDQLLAAARSPDSCAYYGMLAVVGLYIAGEVMPQADVAAAINALEAARRTRNTAWKAVASPLRGLSEDHFEAGLAGLRSLAEHQWRSEVLPSYTLETALQLQIPEFELPTTDVKYIPHIVVPFPESPQLSDSDLWYARDLLLDLLISFRDNTDQMTEVLLKVSNSTLLGLTLAEQVVNKAGSLPLVVYSTTAIRAVPGSADVMKALEATFAFYLRSAEVMDVESEERLARFYSHVISNFPSAWSWSTLVPDDLPDSGLAFLKLVIADLARLLEMDKLTSTLPEKLHIHFPIPQEPILRYADIEESVENTDCQLIIDRIQSKATGQMMKTLLTSKEICNSGDFLLQIFSECLFFHGAKSLLHVTTYLERYSELMHTVKPEIVLEALTEVWRKSIQKTIIICRKLIAMGLLRPEDVLSFACQRIQAGDKALDGNKCDWLLLHQAVKLMPQEKAPLQTLLTWAGEMLPRLSEASKGQLKCRLTQLLLTHLPLSSDLHASAELAPVLASLRAMQPS